MAFIETISASWAAGEAFAMYDRQQRHYGYVPSYATVFCHRPEVMKRWSELLAAIKRPMDKRRFEIATFAAARRDLAVGRPIEFVEPERWAELEFRAAG